MTFSTVGDGLELVLQDDQVLVLEAHDGVDLGARSRGASSATG